MLSSAPYSWYNNTRCRVLWHLAYKLLVPTAVICLCLWTLIDIQTLVLHIFQFVARRRELVLHSIHRLRELQLLIDPRGDRVVLIHFRGRSDREISRRLGFPQQLVLIVQLHNFVGHLIVRRPSRTRRIAEGRI